MIFYNPKISLLYLKAFSKSSIRKKISPRPGYFLSSAKVLLSHLALQRSGASDRGGCCGPLLLPRVYTGRALPLVWLVRHRQRDTFSTTFHRPSRIGVTGHS